MFDYFSVKSIHLIAIVCWFSGLFYLPRLFVYNAMKDTTDKMRDRFNSMQHKLYFYIMCPAMVFTVWSGIYLKILIGGTWATWFSVKMISVTLLVLFHILLYKHIYDFKKNKNTFSEKYFRIINEMPTVALVVIITAVVYRY